MIKTLLVLSLIIIGFTAIPQTIINIPGDLPTIQQGIDSAANGDTVLVDTGTYIENINFNGKNITVASHYLVTLDYTNILNTVIDGGEPSHPDSGSVVMFATGEDSTALLCGFTITNGSGTWMSNQTHGGGIYINNGSSPRLRNLIVTGNVAESANGAGIFICGNSNTIVENVIVMNNDGTGDASTGDGSGGISIHHFSMPKLINVLIINNEGLLAGGIFCNDGSSPMLINVTLANNSAYPTKKNDNRAEMITWQGSHPVLINTVIWNDSLPSIIVRDNEITIGYSNIQGGAIGIENYGIVHWLQGNIDQDPLFVSSGDHPYQINNNSPCIDAGTPDTTGLKLPVFDLAGSTRIYNDRVDMGAYEWNPLVGFELDKILGLDPAVQVYPNPLTISTSFRFELKASGTVTMAIYTQIGQQVEIFGEKYMPPGKHQITWNAEGLQPGLYFYRLTAGTQTSTGRLVVVR
jgi:hypothetical protein